MMQVGTRMVGEANLLALPRKLPEYRDVAELAVIMLSELDSVVALAQWAATLSSHGEQDELRRRIGSMRARAELHSVEDAIQKTRELRQGMDWTVKRQ